MPGRHRSKLGHRSWRGKSRHKTAYVDQLSAAHRVGVHDNPVHGRTLGGMRGRAVAVSVDTAAGGGSVGIVLAVAEVVFHAVGEH